jgi:hypothetical protein
MKILNIFKITIKIGKQILKSKKLAAHTERSKGFVTRKQVSKIIIIKKKYKTLKILF